MPMVMLHGSEGHAFERSLLQLSQGWFRMWIYVSTTFGNDSIIANLIISPTK